MKAVIIHGFEGSADSNWFPWMEAQLNARGYDVFNKSFPNAFHPDVNEVLDFFRPAMDGVDLVIDHSLGAFIALKLSEEFNFSKLILVAPAIGELNYSFIHENWDDSDVDALKEFISTGFNPKAIKAHEKFAFFSHNDPYIPLDLRNLLTGSWTIYDLEDKHHFQEDVQIELLEAL